MLTIPYKFTKKDALNNLKRLLYVFSNTFLNEKKMSTVLFQP